MKSVRRMVTLAASAAMIAGAMSVVTASGASAAATCAGAGQAPIKVGQVAGGALEGVAVDKTGRLYTTDLVSGKVFRVDAPGGKPYEIAKVPSGGGGALAWTPDGTLLVGYGADPRVFIGDALKAAGIVKLDINTLKVTPFVTGLSAADGLAVAKDGTVYATNDFGSLIGRVSPSGVVDPAWAKFPSANGAVLSADDQYLYVSRSFVNPGVSRIPTANPSAPQSLLTFSGLDKLAIPDGLTLDSLGRPVVPTDVSGQVLRIDAPGQACAIASGLRLSSVLTYGDGTSGFSKGRLFRAGFDGSIYEIPGGVV